MTAYTKRWIILVRADAVIAANASSKAVDTVGGEFTWTVGLVKPKNLTKITYYWCNWAMMPSEATALQTILQSNGFTEGNTKLINKGDAIPNNPRAALFPADQWTPSEVLTVLSLQRYDPEAA